MKGWVYIITNKSGYPDLVKVGFSRQDPEFRVKSLNAGHPYECTSEYEFLVDNPSRIENEAKKLLSPKKEGGEWFRCSIEEAVTAIRNVANSSIITEINHYEKRVNEQKLNEANLAYQQKNYSVAFEIYNYLAQQNSIKLEDKLNIQHILGDMYEYGFGVQKNFEEAVKWYQKSVEHGYAKSQYALGGMYYSLGVGVGNDPQKKIELFHKSAEQGYAQAQYRLGLVFDIGYHSETNYEKAAFWYEKAANQGHLKAQTNLKKCLRFIELINLDNSPLDELIEWADFYKLSKENFSRDKKLLLENVALTPITKYVITYIPDAIGELRNLSYLSLMHNKITSIPKSIGNLIDLTNLNLGKNCISIIPDSIG